MSCSLELGARSICLPKLIASGTMRSSDTVEAHIPRFYNESQVKDAPLQVETLRLALRCVAGSNAALSWVATVLGYYDVLRGMSKEAGDGLKAGVCVISAVQIVLVVMYWVYSLRYLEVLRVTLRLSPIAYLSLLRSPGSLANCLGECFYHLLVLPPRVDIEGKLYMMDTYTDISLNDVFFILILLRNYHSLQFLFWFSDFSTKKTYLFASVANINVNIVFILRCYLAHYSLKLLLGIYGAIVIISGLTVFIFEKGTPSTQFEDARSALWFVAYTQTTVGYGEITPITYPGRLTVILSCFIGNFILAILISLSSSTMALTLRECTMYSDLLYGKQKRKYVKKAVLLLQLWWRFIQMRGRKVRHGPTIIAFYSQLRDYRGILTKCQLVKDRRFERQIAAFDQSTAKQFRSILEYMDPIRTAEAYTLDIIRSQYKIKMMARSIKKFATKHKNPEEKSGSLPNSSRKGSIASAGSYGSSVMKTPKYVALKRGKILIRAQRSAYQNLKGRLLRENSARSPLNRSVSP